MKLIDRAKEKFSAKKMKVECVYGPPSMLEAQKISAAIAEKKKLDDTDSDLSGIEDTKNNKEEDSK